MCCLVLPLPSRPNRRQEGDDRLPVGAYSLLMRTEDNFPPSAQCPEWLKPANFGYSPNRSAVCATKLKFQNDSADIPCASSTPRRVRTTAEIEDTSARINDHFLRVMALSGDRHELLPYNSVRTRSSQRNLRSAVPKPEKATIYANRVMTLEVSGNFADIHTCGP